MKTFATYFLLAGALLAVAHAYPASESKHSDPADDAEFIVVPLEHQRPNYFDRYPSSFDSFDGVVDTDDFPHPGQGPVFFPSVNPFTWQFSSYLDDLMKRLRDRFSGSWNPFYGGSDFSHSGPGVWPVEIPDDDSSEDTQTNSTSTVKIIDGHKVIINDTYYTKKNEYGTSIYKVRVIDVKPTEEGETEKPSTDEEKPVETGTRSGSDSDDESPKKDDDGETGSKEPTTVAPRRDTELDASDEETTSVDESVNAIDSNTDIDAAKKVEPAAFHEDNRIGDYLSEMKSAALWESDSVERNVLTNAPHKDREDVSSDEEAGDEDFSPDEWKQHQDDRKRIVVAVNGVTQYPVRNQNQFDADPTAAGETIDLSNDIAINDMLADQSIPLHPDVEVFAPNRRRPTQQDPMQSIPMFPAGFPQSFPGVPNRFPFPNQFPQQFPNRFPQQFPPQQYPQRPIGQFPMQAFPVFPVPNPVPFGHGQRPVQQVPVQQRPGGFGQQTPILMMTFPPNFPAAFRDVRP